MVDLISLTIGLGVGGVAAVGASYLAWRLGKSASKEAEAQLQQQLVDTRARMEERERSLEAQRRLVEADQERLSKEFANLSVRALDENAAKFLRLAAEALAPVKDQLKTQMDGQLGEHRESISGVVKPLETALKEMEGLVHALENARKQEYGGLDKHLQVLMTSTEALRRETNGLSGALRNSQAKGRWGEVALQNVVSLSGMTEHCDFDTQVSLSGMDDRVRPDMVVRLPGSRYIPVDSKLSSSAYLRAVEAPDDKSRDTALEDHAAQVRARVKELSAKDYSEKLRQLGSVPEFVVMFVPGDNLFAAALSKDPKLFDYATEQHVMLASPTVLLPLLRVVELVWRQEKVAENLRRIPEQARELYDRLAKMTEYIQKLGGALDTAVGSYNSFLGSYVSRVMVSARGFKSLGVEGVKPLPESVDPLGTPVRRLETTSLPEVSSGSSPGSS